MEISSWEDEPAAGYESMRQDKSAVAAGRRQPSDRARWRAAELDYKAPAGQGATMTAGRTMAGSRTHDGRARRLVSRTRRQGTGWAGSDGWAGRDGQDAGHTTAGLAEADGGGAAG